MLVKCIACAQCFLLLGVTIIFLVHVGNRTSCIAAKIQYTNFNDTDQKRLFYGKWMTGQHQLSQTCDLENTTRMKCCKKQQHLHFVFNNDKLNQIDPVEEMSQILQQNNIFFIGDSLMREFTFSIGELLGLPVPFNSTKLNFIQANQIFTQRSPPSLNSSDAIPEATIRHALRNYDVIVFNQGLHYMIGPTGLAVYQYRCVGELLQDIASETNKKVIIRSTLPVHFVTASGTGFASDVEGDIWRCLTRVPHPVSHPTNYFLLDMAHRHGFRFLDSFPIYYERGDLTREDKIDCFHHCYTPELVWPELVLLTQLIKH